MISRRRFLASLVADREPAVRFAVIADIQYADKDIVRRRHYRESMTKLQTAVKELGAERLAFSVHLGDLVDGGVENFDRILPVFEKLPGPRYQVLGNHDFFAPRDTVLRKFGLAQPYYSFSVKGWHFVVLDGMNMSVNGGWDENTANYKVGAAMLAELKQQRARNAHDWNGAAGEQQRNWLKRDLQSAQVRKERSVVFCHFPTFAGACRPDHMLWDHSELLAVLNEYPTVAAYINGHDHNGGYAKHQGIHHVTLPGVVENELGKCLRIVEAFPDRLVLRRPGERDGQVLGLER